MSHINHAAFATAPRHRIKKVFLIPRLIAFMIICVSRHEAPPRLPTRLRSLRPRAAASGRVLFLPDRTNLPLSLRLPPFVLPVSSLLCQARVPCLVTCSFLFFGKIIRSLPATLAGLPISPFDWAAPVWDMSPLPALKCSRTTRRRHQPSLKSPISTSHLRTRG